jgi:hypothetical protein
VSVLVILTVVSYISTVCPDVPAKDRFLGTKALRPTCFRHVDRGVSHRRARRLELLTERLPPAGMSTTVHVQNVTSDRRGVGQVHDRVRERLGEEDACVIDQRVNRSASYKNCSRLILSPAMASAARRLRPEAWKNSQTALSSSPHLLCHVAVTRGFVRFYNSSFDREQRDCRPSGKIRREPPTLRKEEAGQ